MSLIFRCEVCDSVSIQPVIHQLGYGRWRVEVRTPAGVFNLGATWGLRRAIVKADRFASALRAARPSRVEEDPRLTDTTR